VYNKDIMTNVPSTPPEFNYDERLILSIVDRIPADARSHFPQHIFEPQRIEIARELVLKEYYKLFPMLEAANFEQVSTSILYWLHGAGYELAPVADFWNYIDGTMITLKLKDVIPQITSANINWQLETLDPHQLRLSTPVGNLAEHGRPPYDYEFINQQILQNAQQMVINRRISDEKSSDTVVQRDHYPVLIRREIDGTLMLLDGNRRTLRSLLYGRTAIDAWVGTVTAQPTLRDHWVNTGFLRRLLSEYADTSTPEVRESIKSQLKIILNSSSIARYNFQSRCVPHYPFAAELAPPKY
jgi:hypothetical protein